MKLFTEIKKEIKKIPAWKPEVNSFNVENRIRFGDMPIMSYYSTEGDPKLVIVLLEYDFLVNKINEFENLYNITHPQHAKKEIINFLDQELIPKIIVQFEKHPDYGFKPEVITICIRRGVNVPNIERTIIYEYNIKIGKAHFEDKGFFNAYHNRKAKLNLHKDYYYAQKNGSEIMDFWYEYRDNLFFKWMVDTVIPHQLLQEVIDFKNEVVKKGIIPDDYVNTKNKKRLDVDFTRTYWEGSFTSHDIRTYFKKRLEKPFGSIHPINALLITILTSFFFDVYVEPWKQGVMVIFYSVLLWYFGVVYDSFKLSQLYSKRICSRKSFYFEQSLKLRVEAVWFKFFQLVEKKITNKQYYNLFTLLELSTTNEYHAQSHKYDSFSSDGSFFPIVKLPKRNESGKDNDN